jgi:hypothetical protein
MFFRNVRTQFHIHTHHVKTAILWYTVDAADRINEVLNIIDRQVERYECYLTKL